MKRKIRLNESDLYRVIKESVKRVLNEVSADKAIASHKINDAVKSDSYHDYFDGYRLLDDNEECCSEKAKSAFIDAVNTIKNGGRFTEWLERHRDITPYVSSSIYSDAERYWEEYQKDNDELNVKPSLHQGTHTQRYRGENLNALDTNGWESMHAQGLGGRFYGMKAIRNGSDMSIEDALKEYDRISNR